MESCAVRQPARKIRFIVSTMILSSRWPGCQGHQVLAINRGEKEKFLKVSLELDHDTAMQTVYNACIKGNTNAADFIRQAAEDAYDRLIFPSLEREIRGDLTDSACEGAIGQFALNLRPLLMQPPGQGESDHGTGSGIPERL